MGNIAPGDPAELILKNRATPEKIEALRDDMGLDEPFIIQYLIYIKNALGGDEIMNISRFPEIMGDAAYVILTKDSKEFTGIEIITNIDTKMEAHDNKKWCNVYSSLRIFHMQCKIDH